MELANVIKKYRNLNDWSQDELADILKVSRQSVSKWE
ncbi:helix-turn-helix transcriptional regulator, partial [Leucobacter aridicollis]